MPILHIYDQKCIPALHSQQSVIVGFDAGNRDIVDIRRSQNAIILPKNVMSMCSASHMRSAGISIMPRF
jgi:hypothetical protein